MDCENLIRSIIWNQINTVGLSKNIDGYVYPQSKNIEILYPLFNNTDTNKFLFIEENGRSYGLIKRDDKIYRTYSLDGINKQLTLIVDGKVTTTTEKMIDNGELYEGEKLGRWRLQSDCGRLSRAPEVVSIVLLSMICLFLFLSLLCGTIVTIIVQIFRCRRREKVVFTEEFVDVKKPTD